MTARAAVTGDPRIAAVAAALGIGDARLTPLAGGTANAALRIQGGGQDVVLRLAGPQATGLGASADAELAMQQVAARAGLAPEILVAWPDRGVLVTRFVAGDCPAPEAVRAPGWILRVGRWLATLHAQAIPTGLTAIDIGERAVGYLAMLRGAGDTPELAAIAVSLARRRAAVGAPARFVPCHHDLHHRNLVLAGDRLLALDWEYSGPGDPAADLAAFARYHDLDDAALGALLAAYGAEAPELLARVHALAWIFDCLWYGWLGAAARAGLDEDRERRAALALRLAR